MSSEQTRLARQWAEKIKADNTITRYEDTHAAAEYILATTTPLTMADVEWDVDEMPGTGALTKHGRLWIMRDDAGDAIECISPNLEEIASVAKKGLTPNGKRYELVEISDEPEHPETLRTVEDYEDAPQGTIVASPFCAPSMKQGERWWRNYASYSNNEIAQQDVCQVLRWGWGE